MSARLCILLAILVAGCDRGPFTEPLLLGGRTYPAAQLNRGYHLYRQSCRACHGDAGDGHGTSAQGLWPPPRDLSQGLYKFGRVPAPGLPPDAELARILRSGLNGTPMLPWAISDPDLDALLGYVKSLSPRWRTDTVGEAVTAGPDPYATLTGDALLAVVERGEVLYHGKAMCSSCHPAYVSRARLFEITKQNGAPTTDYTPAMYGSRIKDTEYCWRWHTPQTPEPSCDEVVRSIPPDFTHDPLRAIRPATVTRDLYLTLAAGISGAGMPPWKGVFSDEELWSLAWYVRSLAMLQGTPEGEALRLRLHAPDNIGWHAPTR